MTTTYVYSVVHAADFYPISDDAETFEDFQTACRVAERQDFPTAIMRAELWDDGEADDYRESYDDATGEWIKYC